MHEDIIEHISHDSGYRRGFDAGMNQAWSLLGELAESYKKVMEYQYDHGRKNHDTLVDVKMRVQTLEYGRYAIQEGMHNIKTKRKDKHE